ncbi:glutathione-dependent reductase [Lentilactobacillus fungorum]|uniref:Glutathione-dependent reductase n=1 Tax=Lentilactobacillus fungorum TaxID=2201250 RepID=A0ABQ3VWL8_9LACO|nr:glutathione S-transferase C-terminal domain-containing protein [Lentilactobacillus fungorum]GHP13293.1 glutathione-dependent reductase [Lentilactobacillus fungorum]
MAKQEKTNAACAWQPKETTSSPFSKRFSTGELPVEPNRYRLIWGRFCPWATPIATMIDYVGLDQVISKGVIYSLRHAGVDDNWFFGKGDEKDPVLQTTSLRENFEKADPNFTDRPTIPALVDVKSGKVVNNSSQTIMNELAENWKAYFRTDVADILPEADKAAILRMADTIVKDITSIPGKIAGVSSQEAYQQLANQYFDRLTWLDQHLADRPFLMGDHVTVPDFWLTTSLIRFDTVFYFQSKLNLKPLTAFPNLWQYAKRCYQIPAFKQNTDFQAIKEHFFMVSDAPVESIDRVLPIGPDESKWMD